MHAITWRISRQTPVLDHNGTLLYRAPRDRVESLLARKDVDPSLKGDRLKSLRFRGPDPALSLEGSHHKRPIGSPHKNESYFNVRGCWHLDRIPEKYREHFVAVLTQVLQSER
jgi:hypothetical protein